MTVDDLKDETLLLLEDGHCLRDQALDVCSGVGVQEKQDFRATSLETLRQMVATGAGVTLLPELASRSGYGMSRDVVLRPFADPQPAPLRRRDLAQNHGPAARDRRRVRHDRKARSVRHNFAPSLAGVPILSNVVRRTRASG